MLLKKNTSTNFNFFILDAHNIKHFEKVLTPYSIDFPENTKQVVSHSLTGIELPSGFYDIDGIKYFFDKYDEVLPMHYLIELTV